ncbi:MAG TPA: hypothetical protein VG206_17370 [Terriglobia bacterium]|nr:hypothetical protein [Terriglobia bacterium]
MGQLSYSDLGFYDSNAATSSQGKRGNGSALPEGEFAVFSQDEKGPMWRQCFLDLETAKAKAQELAIEEGLEFFVFSLKDSSEVTRFFPKPKPGTPRA